MDRSQLRISRRYLISESITISFYIFAAIALTSILIIDPPGANENTLFVWCAIVFLYSFSLIFSSMRIIPLYAAIHTTFSENGIVKHGMFQRKYISWNTVVAVDIQPSGIILDTAEDSTFIRLSCYTDPEPIRAFILAHLPADLVRELEQSQKDLGI